MAVYLLLLIPIFASASFAIYAVARYRKDELRAAMMPATLIACAGLLIAAALLLYGALPLWAQLVMLVLLLLLCLRIEPRFVVALYALPLLLLGAFTPTRLAVPALTSLLLGCLAAGVLFAIAKSKL